MRTRQCSRERKKAWKNITATQLEDEKEIKRSDDKKYFIKWEYM